MLLFHAVNRANTCTGKIFSKVSITLALFLSITGCANQYTFSSNLDKQNFTDYFAPGRVTVYADEKDILTNFQFMAVVEGSSCQARPHLALPSESEARTEARIAADGLDANGIVFTQCIDTKTQECIALKICYGKAYKVQAEQ